jgi:hypothetical protein
MELAKKFSHRAIGKSSATHIATVQLKGFFGE